MQITSNIFEPKAFMEEVLMKPLFAHLSTLDESGPKDSPLWFLWEHASLWMLGHENQNTFINRLTKDPRCAVGIIDFNAHTGLVHHIGFRGKASIEAHNEEIVQQLFAKYMGEKKNWDPRFTEVIGKHEWKLVKMTPETVVVRDQSYNKL